jgi:predicted ArsR family transcriptional regulator
VLANCPFHALAQRDPELVCGMNLAFVEGVVDGLGAAALRARLDPSETRCCVRLERPRLAG